MKQMILEPIVKNFEHDPYREFSTSCSSAQIAVPPR